MKNKKYKEIPVSFTLEQFNEFVSGFLKMWGKRSL
jgi:hypothetical protein